MGNAEPWPESTNRGQNIRIVFAKWLPALAGMALFAADGSVHGGQWLVLPIAGAVAMLLLFVILGTSHSLVGWIAGWSMPMPEWELSPSVVGTLVAMTASVAVGQYVAGSRVDRIIDCVADAAPYANAEQVQRMAAHCQKARVDRHP
jgi:hypothetical protein